MQGTFDTARTIDAMIALESFINCAFWVDAAITAVGLSAFVMMIGARSE